jgi:hypothetical protein
MAGTMGEHKRQKISIKDSIVKWFYRYRAAKSDFCREPRVRQIIEPMLAGGFLGEVPPDDRQYVIDLGLVKRDPMGGLVIANPIYRKVILDHWPVVRRIRCRLSYRNG